MKPETDVYFDESLKRFDFVYPAAGSSNSVLKINLEKFYEISACKKYVDVCKPIE